MVIVAVVLAMATGMGYTRTSRHVSTEWCFTLTVPSKKPNFTHSRGNIWTMH